MADLVKKIRTDKGDLQIDYGSLANLPAFNNNLLINSDFRNPVNQRGQTSYTGTGSTIRYTIDRWGVVNGSIVTVQDDSLKIQVSSADTYSGRFKQVFENALPSAFYTLSVKVKSNTHNVEINNFGKIPAGFTGIYSHTSIERSLSDIEFFIAKGASIEIEWIKLEQGTAATPFVPRLYAEEVYLCKRFFQTVNLYWRPGVVNSAGTVISFVADVPLRTVTNGSPLVELYQVPTRIRTTSSNVVDTTFTLESAYLSSGTVVINIYSSTSLEARSIAVPIDNFKLYVDAEIR